MMSGILWIPHLKTLMFTFQFKANFVTQSNTMNPMKKSDIVDS